MMDTLPKAWPWHGGQHQGAQNAPLTLFRGKGISPGPRTGSVPYGSWHIHPKRRTHINSAACSLSPSSYFLLTEEA